MKVGTKKVFVKDIANDMSPCNILDITNKNKKTIHDS